MPVRQIIFSAPSDRCEKQGVEVTSLVQAPSARKQWGRGSDTGLSGSRTIVLNHYAPDRGPTPQCPPWVTSSVRLWARTPPGGAAPARSPPPVLLALQGAKASFPNASCGSSDCAPLPLWSAEAVPPLCCVISTWTS